MITGSGRAGSAALASRGRGSWLVFATLAGVVVVIDQVSKAWVTASFQPASPLAPPDAIGGPTSVIGDLVRIALSYNDGGIFGLLGASATMLGAASLVVIGAIIVIEAREGLSNPLLTIALGFLLGGAVGNLLDRFRLAKVVDWVDMGIGDLRWYTFNVADAAISISIVLLIVLGLFGPRLGRLVGLPPMGAAQPARPDGEPTRGVL